MNLMKNIIKTRKNKKISKKLIHILELNKIMFMEEENLVYIIIPQQSIITKIILLAKKSGIIIHYGMIPLIIVKPMGYEHSSILNREV